MLRRLDEEGVRLTGRRELVVNAIADKPGSFTPEALVDELRPHGIGQTYRNLRHPLDDEILTWRYELLMFSLGAQR